jgi:hypothetical protein
MLSTYLVVHLFVSLFVHFFCGCQKPWYEALCLFLFIPHPHILTFLGVLFIWQ